MTAISQVGIGKREIEELIWEVTESVNKPSIEIHNVEYHEELAGCRLYIEATVNKIKGWYIVRHTMEFDSGHHINIFSSIEKVNMR